MKVLLYTIPGCPWCLAAKKHLDDKKIKYKEQDVLGDRSPVKEKSGQESVPTAVFTYKDGSEKILPDFDVDEIDKFLTEDVE